MTRLLSILLLLVYIPSSAQVMSRVKRHVYGSYQFSTDVFQTTDSFEYTFSGNRHKVFIPGILPEVLKPDQGLAPIANEYDELVHTQYFFTPPATTYNKRAQTFADNKLQKTEFYWYISDDGSWDNSGNVTYEYDDKGRIVKALYTTYAVNQYIPEELVSQYFEYDDNGNLISLQTIPETPEKKVRFEYNTQNNLVKSVVLTKDTNNNWTGKDSSTVAIKYDNQGRITERLWSTMHYVIPLQNYSYVQYKTTYDYSVTDELTVTEYYNDDNTNGFIASNKYRYNLDVRSRILSCTKYGISKSTGNLYEQERKEWEYNSFDQVTRLDVFRYNDKKWQLSISHMLDYELFCTDEDNDMHITVYPVPAKNSLKVSACKHNNSAFEVAIFDNTGRKVKQWQPTVGDSFAEEIDITGLANGVYMINANAGKKAASAKFIVAH